MTERPAGTGDICASGARGRRAGPLKIVIIVLKSWQAYAASGASDFGQWLRCVSKGVHVDSHVRHHAEVQSAHLAIGLS